MAFFSTEPCTEIRSSASETWTDEGLSASATLSVPWARRYHLLEDVLTNRRAWPHHGDDLTTLRASSATIAGWGCLPTLENSPQLYQYEKAHVTVNYQPILINPDDDNESYDYVQETFEPEIEFINLDHKKFKWSDGDVLAREESPGRRVARFRLNRTYFGLRQIPPGVITRIGKCNAQAYTSALLGITFPPETIRLDSSVPSRTIRSDLSFAWTLRISFSFKEEGWNKYWRAKTQQYERLQLLDGTEYNNYPTDSLSDVLQ